MNVSVVLFAGILLTGCSQPVGAAPDEQVTSNVEKNLRLVASGTNMPLTFKADRPGTLRVYDFQNDQYLFTGALKAGDQFTLVPQADHATVNKEPVFLEHATNRYDEYRLYFMGQ
jgi:hypothetical protein